MARWFLTVRRVRFLATSCITKVHQSLFLIWLCVSVCAIQAAAAIVGGFMAIGGVRAGLLVGGKGDGRMGD